MEAYVHAPLEAPICSPDSRGRIKVELNPAFGPPDVAPPSRLTRLLTSWKLWMCALVLSIAAIGASLGIRGHQRYLALKYIEHHGEYELSAESEWITERFGDWAKGFRDVDFIYLEEVSDESFARISAFPELRRLRTNHLVDVIFRDRKNDSISNEGLASLFQLTQLEDVHFSWGGMRNEQLTRWFATRPALRSVTLHAMSPTRETMEALSKISTLTELHIPMFQEHSDEEFRDLAPMPSLRSLTLPYVETHKARWISGATNLRELEIRFTTVTPEIMQCVANLKELESLSLVSCKELDNAGLQSLVELPRLKSVTLPVESITWESFETLRRMPRLERVVLDGGRRDIHDHDLREAVEQEWEVRSTYTGCF